MKKAILFFAILFCAQMAFCQIKIEVPKPVKPNLAELEKLTFGQVEHNTTNSTGKIILLETENGDTIQLNDFWLIVHYYDDSDIFNHNLKGKIENVLENLNFDYITEVKLMTTEHTHIFYGKKLLIIRTTEKLKKEQKKSDNDFKFIDINDFLIRNKEILLKQNNLKLLKTTFYNPQ